MEWFEYLNERNETMFYKSFMDGREELSVKRSHGLSVMYSLLYETVYDYLEVKYKRWGKTDIAIGAHTRVMTILKSNPKPEIGRYKGTLCERLF